MRLHSSNPNLSTLDFGEEKSYSDGSEASSEFSKMQEDLCHVAHKGEGVFLLPNIRGGNDCQYKPADIIFKGIIVYSGDDFQ